MFYFNQKTAAFDISKWHLHRGLEIILFLILFHILNKTTSKLFQNSTSVLHEVLQFYFSEVSTCRITKKCDVNRSKLKNVHKFENVCYSAIVISMHIHVKYKGSMIIQAESNSEKKMTAILKTFGDVNLIFHVHLPIIYL